MNNNLKDFFTRLSTPNAPSFLLLGQGYQRIESNSDSFLETILKRFASSDEVNDYSNIFCDAIDSNQEAARAWISERATKLITPAWLEEVANFAWSGVYTSSFDLLLNRAFRSDWRSTQPIYSPDYQPIDPRNRLRLHISYLYGSIEQEEEDKKSPLNDYDLIKRKLAAQNMLMRLKEYLTPLGTLAIEGYNENSDWLTVETLYTLISNLDTNQVYFFVRSIDAIKSKLLLKLIGDKKIIVIEDSLGSALNNANEAGLIKLGQNQNLPTSKHTITSDSTLISIPMDVRDRISRFGTILDDSVLTSPPSYSPEKRYSEFRNFLSESGLQVSWSAYTLNLAFNREYEQQLIKVCKSMLNRPFDSEPLILHGQTGAGKTVALGALAYQIYKELRAPIIFIQRRTQRVSQGEIDKFCEWAEKENLPPSLIVWDGMQNVEQYYTLHKFLTGRGRKFLLVASTYRIEASEAKPANYILAPVELSPAEVQKFELYLSQFEETLGNKVGKYLKGADSSFLVALYRLLPETRAHVRRGLQIEVGLAEYSLRAKSEKVQPQIDSTNILARALDRAGLLDKRHILSNETSEINNEIIRAEDELIGLIMVPGRFGLSVPIEILMRALSKVRISNFSEIFEGIDLFRWSEDEQGNILIGSRHPLEAKLIAQSRLGGADREIEYANKLIKHIKSIGLGSDNSEVHFAAQLIQNIGPNGPEGKLYTSGYLDIVQCLKDIRETAGVVEPRLMLQEATLLREAVSNLIPIENYEGRIKLLEQAQLVLADALEKIGPSKKVFRIKSMLLVELASSHGSMVKEMINADYDSELIVNEFYKAYEIAMQARTYQPESCFPVDVIAWSAKDLLASPDLNNEIRLEISANILHSLSVSDSDAISKLDQEMLNKRILELSLILKDVNLEQESLEKLSQQGSTAGYYMIATSLAGRLLDATASPTIESLPKITTAVDYLIENYEHIKHDSKCLYLLMRHWWSVNSMLSFFPSERTALPFKNNQWEFLLRILRDILTLDDVSQTPYLMYLEAISLWHLNRLDEAEEVWRQLQRDSDRVTGRRRVLKTFLASDQSGNPREFHGAIQHISEDGNKGTVFVDGLRRQIPFFTNDFNLSEVSRDEQLNKFHIAFNYIAPTADPAFRYGKHA